MLKRTSIAAATVLATACSSVIAHPGTRIWLGVNGNKVATYGSNNDLSPSTYFDKRLFIGGGYEAEDEEEISPTGEFDQPVPGVYRTTWPGYEPKLSGSGFGGSELIGFNITEPLRKYDPNTDSFKLTTELFTSPAPQMAVTYPTKPIIRTGYDSITYSSYHEGFDYLSASTHEHLAFTFLGDGVNAVEGPAGSDGVYALGIQQSSGSRTSSQSYFILFGKNTALTSTEYQNAITRAADLLTLPTVTMRYWDANGNGAGAGSNPAGTWGVDANWNNVSAGTFAPTAWIDGDHAVFSAGTDASSAYTVNVSGTRGVGGIRFDEGTVTLTGGTINLIGPLGTSITALPGITGTIASTLSGTSPLTTNGAGTVVLSGNANFTGATTVQSGTLELRTSLTSSASLAIRDGALLRFAANGTRVIKTPSLSFAGSGQLDLGDNKLVITSASYAGVASLVASGRNDGAWNGPGIMTSQPEVLTNYTSIGVATALEAGYAGSTFAGVSVSASDVLVMYTYGGDANLSGYVDIDDYGLIDFNASTGGSLSGWYNGDFDYNGVQDIDDYGIIDFVVSIQGPPFPTAAAVGVTSVPEPSAACGLAVFLCAIASRPRRR